jgi:hypothetical protein
MACPEGGQGAVVPEVKHLKALRCHHGCCMSGMMVESKGAVKVEVGSCCPRFFVACDVRCSDHRWDFEATGRSAEQVCHGHG